MSASEVMDRLNNLMNAIDHEISMRLAPPVTDPDNRLAGKMDSWRIAVKDIATMLQTLSAPPRVYVDAEQWSRITALLALPADALGSEVVTCVQLAVKRLAELELKVATADTSASMADNPTTNENLDKRVGSLEARVKSLESVLRETSAALKDFLGGRRG